MSEKEFTEEPHKIAKVIDKKIQELEAKVQRLEMFIEIMTALNNEQLVKKAVEQLKQQGFKETFVFGDKENAYYTHLEDKTKSFKVKRNDATELLNKLAELQQQEQQKKRRIQETCRCKRWKIRFWI